MLELVLFRENVYNNPDHLRSDHDIYMKGSPKKTLLSGFFAFKTGASAARNSGSNPRWFRPSTDLSWAGREKLEESVEGARRYSLRKLANPWFPYKIPYMKTVTEKGPATICTDAYPFIGHRTRPIALKNLSQLVLIHSRHQKKIEGSRTMSPTL